MKITEKNKVKTAIKNFESYFFNVLKIPIENTVVFLPRSRLQLLDCQIY